jgi:anti-anti-sigma factor
MPVSRPDDFTVRTSPKGALVLGGELDVATIQRLQDKIDEALVPGQPIVLDLAELTFLDTSAMHCFVGAFESTGHPVVLLKRVTCTSSHLGGHDATARGMGVRRRESVLGPERSASRSIPTSTARSVRSSSQSIRSSAKARLSG